MVYLVKTHKPGTIYQGPHTFVLNRGHNTGKVLPKACPNCWVIISDCQQTIDRLEFIIHSLYLTKRWRYELIGSVIVYVRIRDFRKILDTYVKVLGLGSHLDPEIERIRKVQQLLNQYERARLEMRLKVVTLYLRFLRGV